MLVRSLDWGVSASQTYGTYEYFKITLDRLWVQNAFLQAGVNVFLIEADAVWFSPLSEYFLPYLRSSAIVSADDRGNGRPLISS